MQKIILKIKNLFLVWKTKVPVILQFSDTECGIASLAMVFAHHKMNLSIEKLREKCGVSRDGCKAQTLLTVAKHYGFNAEAYKVDIDGLNEFSLPVIAYWNFNHYVVINNIKANKVSINDPAHGEMIITMAAFDKAFTGVILEITPTQHITVSKKTFSLLKFIQKWFSGFHSELCYLLLLLSLIGTIPYLSSVLFKIFIDQGILAKNNNLIPDIIFLTFLTSTILIFLTFIYKRIQFKLHSKASLKKISEILSHIFQLPMLFFSLRQRSEIVSVLNRAEFVTNLIFENALVLMLGMITSTVCFIFMIEIDWVLSLLSLLLTVISLILFVYLSRIKSSSEKSNAHLVGKLYSHSISSIRNIETIKACGLEESIFKKWRTLFFNKMRVQGNDDFLAITALSLRRMQNQVSSLSIVYLGAYQVACGSLSLGNLMGYYSLLLIFQNGISRIFQGLQDSQAVYANNTRLDDILSYDKDPRFTPKQVIKKFAANEKEIISLSQVTFYYNKNSSPVLNDINLKISRGDHVALVGGTGSGKSTLAKLICGFYPPTEGEILFNKNLLSNHSADELATLYAYVSQDVSLFSGTILQNLLFSNENASQVLLEQSISDACLSELIANRKLSGVVDEEGRNFSGGEKQRIDLARALIQDTPILILDEATSAMDENTEQAIIKNLRKNNKTIIFVAHRLSTIQHCDQIYVLNKGSIVEQGKHQELIENQSYYYSLVANEATLRDSMLCD